MDMTIAPTKSTFGFEEAMVFLMIEKFGGKFTRLGDVFNFGSLSSLRSRKVTLVLLKFVDDNEAC